MPKNPGKVFERRFKECTPKYCLMIRLKDNPTAYDPNYSFSTNNPCDYICYDTIHKILVPMELKSTKARKMNMSMIRDNQMKGLTDFAKYDNVYPCFIFNFRDELKHNDRCYCMHICDYNEMVRVLDKHSFNEDDILEYGGMSIDGTKARTRWTWDVDGMLCDIADFINGVCDESADDDDDEESAEENVTDESDEDESED